MKIPKDAPKRVYIQHDPEETGDPFSDADEVTWCAHRINKSDLEYVRVDLAAVPEAADTSRYKEALKHILWIKECGVDGTDKNGKFRNFPETERDGMYKIAKDALEPQPSEKS